MYERIFAVRGISDQPLAIFILAGSQGYRPERRGRFEFRRGI